MDALNLINELKLAETQKSKAVLLDNFPAWIRATINVYEIKLSQGESIYLINPTKNLQFEQLTNILNLVEKRLAGITLLVADEINPKFRSLFVKNNIPFIFKDKSLFAPMLGIKLFDYKSRKVIKSKLVNEELNAFELKLLAGYLTGFIAGAGFNLNQLNKILEINHYQCSKSKLSQAVIRLVEFGYLEVKGSGPNRIVNFKDKNLVWEELKDAPLKRFSKTVAGYNMIERQYISSNETALANYSELADPRINYIAITNKELIEIEKIGKPIGDFGKPLFMFDVMKEAPQLFSKDNKYLNSVELYLMMRNNSDERIQISLEQMMSDLGFKI